MNERMTNAKAEMERLTAEITEKVQLWNKKSLEDETKPSELSKLSDEMDEMCKDFAKHSKAYAYELAIEQGENIFLNLVKIKTFPTITVSTGKDKETKANVKSVKVSDRHIDPVDFETVTNRLIGGQLENSWKSAVANLGYRLCLWVAANSGKAGEVERVRNSFDLGKGNEAFRNGATPWSNKQLENALNDLIEKTIKVDHKVKKADVFFVQNVCTSIGKEAREIKFMATKKFRERILMDYLYNVVVSAENENNAGYSVSFKEKKEK